MIVELLGLICSQAGPTDALAVVPILIAESETSVSFSAVHGSVSEASRDRLGLRLVPPEQVLVEPDLVTAVSACGSDAACLAHALRGLRAKLALVVLVNTLASPGFVALRLVDTESQQVLGEALGPIGAEEGTSDSAVRDRASRLLDRAGYSIGARLLLQVHPSDATLVLSPGGPTTGGERLLAPGHYRIEAAKDGYRSASAEVSLAAGSPASVELRLEPEPPLIASPWLWLGIGVAAIAGGVAAAFVLGSTRCVCFASAGVECVDC